MQTLRAGASGPLWRRRREADDLYQAWEIRLWSRVLLVVAGVGTSILLVDVFVDYLSGSAFAFTSLLVVLLYITAMFNHTWARQEQLAHSQDKLQTMFMAFVGPEEQQLPD
ncbi:hypothetical protein J4573_18605 [Actinomadura barringtoniae]|uniref:Uncharacterized protein n=1 Tax=Actinomadura barringtoniae TaxID=1427535 RepID=A0A939T7A9_9ACTN|nr:hypothetical protein [Actinomadura barringtoniae]MBO2449122.1 hypothetical protein [Actinomadura barringtoniae]